jgi:hypothetical protein
MDKLVLSELFVVIEAVALLSREAYQKATAMEKAVAQPGDLGRLYYVESQKDHAEARYTAVSEALAKLRQMLDPSR